MFRQANNNSQTFVAGVFCEMTGAAGAVRTLSDCGFGEHEIELIGVLSSTASDLGWMLESIGVPAEELDLYSSCFEHGAVLVIVRTLFSHRRQVARQVLQRHGGTFPTEA